MHPKEILIIVGGAWHNFDGFGQAAKMLFEQSGYSVRVTFDFDQLLRLDQIKPHCVLSYTSLGNAVDSSGRVGKDLSAEQIDGLVEWVAKGNTFVGVHCASVTSKESAAYSRLLGGRFLSHPDPFSFNVELVQSEHPVCEQVTEFEVFDEFYISEWSDDIDVLMNAKLEGTSYPMVWSRKHELGRTVYVGPGHFREVWMNPSYRKLLLNAVEWATGE